jgi:D-alanyl-lipoteichoic acid acyltransferase DltB (MBOAT superfamily)
VHDVLSLLQYDPQQPLVFNSGFFLAFLAICLFLNRLFYRFKPLRIGYLAVFSLYFYYKTTGFFFLFLAGCSFVDFLIARRMDEVDQPWRRKLLLAASISVNLLVLGYFKYTNFLIETFNALFNGTAGPLDIFLPAGISFYTFQSLSYTIDVYRKEVRPLRNYVNYCFCISFFPHLVAGPIIRASTLIPQLDREYYLSRNDVGAALYLIGAGLIKKAVIADALGESFVDRVFDEPLRYSGTENLLAVYLYAVQIYCDFSGYSDIAIGVAKMLGFDLPINFNAPYLSATCTEFWHRWHISLSSWLRDYVYISLGGNRSGVWRQCLNLMITMFLAGLWHGASLRFVAWGLMHGLWLSIERLLHIPSLADRSRIAKAVLTVITFNLVCFAWIFFRAESWDTAFTVINRIASGVRYNEILFFAQGYALAAFLFVLAMGAHLFHRELTDAGSWVLARSGPVLQTGFVVAIIFLTLQVRSAKLQPFIYFQF